MTKTNQKSILEKLLVIYGRKPVLEALQDTSLEIHKLHLAESNRPATILEQCENLARQRQVPVEYHDKRKLSFISKNAKQDQGIALDIKMQNFHPLDSLQTDKYKQLILVDNITNPQNLGMIIRSVAAGYVDGLVIPEKGCAALGPLVIKASTGAIFKATIFRCKNTLEAIEQLRSVGYETRALSLEHHEQYHSASFKKPGLFILGNETEGVSRDVLELCDMRLKIEMRNSVESLNVAMAATIIAFDHRFL